MSTPVKNPKSHKGTKARGANGTHPIACTDRNDASFKKEVLDKIRERGRRAMSWANVPQNGVILVTGFRGEGKTALSWWLADTLRQTPGYPSQVVAYGLHQDAVAELPRWSRKETVSNPSEVSALKKSSIIIVDEAVFSANARRAMSDENLDWMKLFAITRHKGHLLIFISQTSRQVDIQLVDQADWLLMKKPSMLQVKIARSELRSQLEEAFLELDKKRDSRKWVYAYNPKTDSGKLLKSSMPLWWTAKLSKAYSSVIL
jgi:hypothetical protein